MEAAAGALAGGQAPGPDGDRAAAARGPLERLRVLAAAALRLAPERVPDGKPLSLLGLDSLAAAELRHGIAETWAVELELEQVLSGPTLEELARLVAPRRREPTVAPPSTGRPCSIAGRLPRAAGAGGGGEAEAVLSFAQERLWFLDQLEPGSAVYNQPAALRLAGPLDVAALAASLDEVRRRHEVLRTRFVARAGGVAAVAAAASPPHGPAAAHRGREPAWPRLPLIDLAPLPAGRRQALAERLTAAQAVRPFDLAGGPPLRLALLRLAGNGGGSAAAAEHRLLVTLHHIAADGWSLEVLARELGALYAAAVTGMPPPAAAVPRLPIQYVDFARWQRARFAGDTLAAEVGWWREQLAGPRGAPPPLDLPLDRPRPAVPSSRGARLLATLPADLADRLAALAQRCGATRFMVLLAVLAVLLGRTAGTADLAIGIAAANRGRREVRDLIGLFVNTLVIRVDLGGDPGFAALLARVRHAAQGAYAHQEAPFDKVVGGLAPRRALAEVPLFRVFFAQQPAPPPIALPGLAVEHLDVQTGTAKLDLALAVSLPAAGTLRCAWTWRTELFETATVTRLASQFENLLHAIVDRADRRLSELPLLGPAERHQLLVEWSTAPGGAGAREPRGSAVHELFAAQAAERPRAAAVRAGAAELTYGELTRRAAAVGSWLRRRGVGPEVPVGLWMDRSPEAVVGMLGIFMAGGVYLPLDPAYPGERLDLMLAAAGARALLTQAAAPQLPPLARRLPRLELGAAPAELPEPGAGAAPANAALASAAAASATDVPAAPIHPDQAAYIFFTSGSTGRPKGVVVSHGALANRIHLDLEAGCGPGDRYLMRSSLGFDVSLVQVWTPLATGGTVIVAAPGSECDARYLARLIREEGITHASFPSPQLDALLADPELADLGRLRFMAAGVEAMPPELPARFFRLADGRRAALWNRYGPTEATIAATQWRCRPEPEPRGVPIGRPFVAASVLLLDAALRPAPLGAVGEIAIGGGGVARGYLGDPALTAARFAPDPLPDAGGRRGGARLYRTGDLGRWRGDGALEFVGRLDRQVKIRGFRVEPGEIAAALGRHRAVGEAVAVAWPAAEPSRSPRLAAYYTLREPGGAGQEELRSHLRRLLPEHMLPWALVEVAALPFTPAGKVDLAALPHPGDAAGAAAARRAGDGTGAPAPALTPIEETLAAIWRELLGVEQVAADDNFFELGGDSVLSIRVVARAREAGLALAPRDLFARQTLAELAALPGIAAEAARGGSPPAAGPGSPATGPGELPGFELDQEQLDAVLEALRLPPAEEAP